MKKPLYFILIFISLNAFSQTTIVDNTFKFNFKKTIKNSRHFEVYTSEYFIKANKYQKKIQIRFKIKSIAKKKKIFDPNKFYLVLDKYKKRVRPVDIKHNFVMTAFIGFNRLIDKKQKDKNKAYWYSYKPSIRDSFLDYKMDGYDDVDNSINFGTKRKPIIKSIYFDHKQLKSNTVDIYFIVPKLLKKGKIYYGDVLLANFDVK